MSADSISAKVKPQRADGQRTGLAGEFFVAAELLRHGLQASLTMGNAKAIDLFAHNEVTGKTFAVQVKSVRNRNYFPISHRSVVEDHIYVFVIVHAPGKSLEYFIVPGVELLRRPEQFGRWYLDTKFPAIHPKHLELYRDAWSPFTTSVA